MPILSGFLPIPLAMMIPFMGAQSLVLGKAFGEGFQYGKRKISALTNEEFNKLTPSDIAANSRKELQDMIPEMKASISDMRDFQSFIVHELIATARQLPSDIFQGVTGQGNETSVGKAFDATVSSFLPQAFADTAPQTTQKFADFYYNEAMKLPDALLISIVKTFGTRTDISVEKRTGYIQAFNERNPTVTPLTSQQQFEQTSSAVLSNAPSHGVVASIAIQFAKLKLLLETTSTTINTFLSFAKVYNQFVAANGHSSLQIDTAKSWAAKKLISK